MLLQKIRDGEITLYYTGHSHGGGIGWHIVLNYPGMMEGFVSICGGPHPKNGEQTGTISKFSRGATIAAAKAGMDVYREHIHQAALYYAKPLTGDETPEEAAKIRAANQGTILHLIPMKKQLSIPENRSAGVTLKRN